MESLEKEFKKYAEKSAGEYWKFLNKYNKGRIPHEVARFSVDERAKSATVYFKSNPKYYESLKVSYNSKDYSNEFTAKKYDAKAKFVVFSVSPKAIKLLNSLKSNNPDDGFKIESDLTFLVSRVKDWYSKNSLCFNRMPSMLTPPSDLDLSDVFSDEQHDAINTVFSSPVSYIWGAPGTGKTRYVLSGCLIHYFENNLKTLVCAPTNNSLEQVLFAFLGKLEEAGGDAKRVLRLGTPSNEFYSKYPDSCFTDYEKHVFDTYPEKIQKLDNYIKYIKANETLSFFNSACQSKIEKAKSISIENGSLSQKVQAIECEIRKLKETLAESMSLRGLSKIKRCLSSYNPKKIKADIEENETAIKHLRDSLENRENKQRVIASELQSALESKALEFIKDNQHFTELKHRIPELDFSGASNALNKLRSYLSKYDQPDLFGKEYTSRSVDDIEEEYNKMKKELEKVRDKRNIDRLVIAATLDTYIGNINIDKPKKENMCNYKPKHIFLDEAGYSNVIKAMTLFRSNCPVTFLGDHKQLEPVCEMNKNPNKNNQDSIIENCNEVFLWAAKAMYSTLFFENLPDSVYEKYLADSFPQYDSMPALSTAALTRSYRYGKDMAAILDEYVYKNHLMSAAKTETKIKVFSVPGRGSKHNHENSSEADVIKKYISQNKPSDCAILTPYKDQRSLLKKTLKSIFPEECIMTIHTSQGQEFETVILSVADYSDSKNVFFTSTGSPSSKHSPATINILNTAISRAKSELIVVCDGDYWENKKGELISALIEYAKENGTLELK